METFIENLLKMALKKDIVSAVLQTSMERFQAAFTSKNYNEDDNYEFFEQLGDLSINKFIVSYMSKRFPHLKSSQGVGVLASLRILYGSKDVLSSLSDKYGMDKFIRCTQEETIDKNRFKDILEDVFEAFFGALEYSIDKLYFPGMGYISVYSLLQKMFDDIEVKIDYKSLVDAKTRLNELKDEAKLNVVYQDRRMPNGLFLTELLLNSKLVARGEAPTKKVSQNIASENALDWIEQNLKITKEVPERYKTLARRIW